MVDIDFLHPAPACLRGRSGVHGGNVYEIKRRYKKDAIDFSANINPLGLPAELKKAISIDFDKILHYPDPEARDVTQKIGEYWGIDEKNILVGNGSVELIYLIMFTFRPKTTLIPLPTFSEYERAARCIKSKIRFVRFKKRDNFKLKEAEIRKADILFLCNPNNPTGNLILEDYRIIDRLPTKLIVVDEAFMDFLPNQRDHTLIWEAVKTNRLVVLRTFTKFFALPGLRIGYLVAHKDIINELKKHQPPWSTNFPAQLAAELILEDKEYIKDSIRLVEKERKFLSEEIVKIGFDPYPSITNFLLIKIKDGDLTSSLLREKLIQKGILIRDCANFRGLNNKFIRIAVRSHKENLKLIKALKEVI